MTSPVLHLQHVHKTYVMGDSEVQALKGIDLTIEAGEFTALKGPSGSGKSTLLNICGLLDRADCVDSDERADHDNEGSVELLGNRLNRLSDRELTLLRRQHIGFVFQSYNLLPVLSAHENIEYPLLLCGASRHDREKRVVELVEQVGLSAFANHRPDHLSGGQRQRVAIARALIKQPRLVIADEPTANLDTATASQMIELMHELGKSRGTTFLIATHDERMAQRCDRVLSMVDGVISGQQVQEVRHEVA